MKPSLLATLVGLTAALVGRSARSAPPPAARLTYVRDEPCPSEARFVESVAERLGYAPFAPAASRTVVVTLEREGSTYRGRVTLTDAEGRAVGQRAIASSPTCEEAATTAAFVVAVLLEPGGRPQAPTPQAPAPAPAPPALAPPAQPPAEELTPIAVSGGLESVVSVGPAPATALGAAAFGALRRGALLVSLEARADLPASDDEEDPSARTWLAHGNVVPCLARDPVAACALISVGAMWGEGTGTLAASRVATVFYLAAGGRLEVSLPLGGVLFLRAHVDLVAPITRPSFAIGVERVYDLPVLAGALGLGLGVRFR